MFDPLNTDDEKTLPQIPSLKTRRELFALASGAFVSSLALVPARAAVAGLAETKPAESNVSGIATGGARTGADFPISEAMNRLSIYISESRDRALPEDVIEKSKWRVLDTLAAIVSGSELPGGRASIAFVRAYGGKAVSTVIGDSTVCGPIEAALANGTMGHSDETDDVGAGPWHPGVNVIPASLALGEQFGISGMHWLRAMAVGYDIGSRIEQAAGVKIDFRNPTNSMGGVFGATAAAACAASLTAEQTRWALSYGAQQCSGLDSFRRDLDHIEKGFMNGGMGARSGVTAALLVLAGFNAVNDVFSGQGGFFGAYSSTAKPERMLDKLGEDFYMADSYMKRWPVGGPIQAPMDAVTTILKRQKVDPNKIKEIAIRQLSDSITDNGGPTDVNVQHAIALTLVDGQLTFKSIHDKTRLKDPAVVRLRSLTRIVPGPTWGPESEASTVPLIQISMNDGTKIVQNNVTSGIPGTASKPYTREFAVNKSRSLLEPVLGKAQSDKLIQHVLTLESLGNVLQLRSLLQRA